MDIRRLYQENEAYIIEMRRWFHMNPELSLKEKETANKIKMELENMKIPYINLAPNYGILATIEGGKKGKTIALRADIDALPVSEDANHEYVSKNPGVMHACGHDAHIAMLLGAAKVLSSIREKLNGKVLLVFQVAEEVGAGHQEILNYFESIGGVDAVAGLHIWSGIPEGEILLIPGSVFAGGKGFEVIFKGEGGHGARPDLVKDPIKACCEAVLKLASIPSNFYDVLDHSVVSVGKVEAGTIANVFPSEAKICGGFRWYKKDGDKAIAEKIDQILDGISRIYGVKYNLNLIGGIVPVKNDDKLISRAIDLLEGVNGLELAKILEPICASDNFGFILEKYRGFYGILGAGNSIDSNFPQHHCKFNIDEKALRKGSEFMSRFVVDFLDNEGEDE